MSVPQPTGLLIYPTMLRNFRILPVFFALLGVGCGIAAQESASAPGGSSGGAARDGIMGTPHNLLGNKDTKKALDGRGEREVCVFCHTPSLEDAPPPDGALNTRFVPAPPRWYRSIDPATTFQLYDDIGRAELDSKRPVGSQSVGCLSCHDAAQAVGVSAGVFGYDHPFGVPYRGGFRWRPQAYEDAKKGIDRDGPFREGRFIQNYDDFRAARDAIVGGRQVWWVPVDMQSAIRTRADLPLYGRPLAEDPGSAVPFIECTSCHDPHLAQPLFLRVPNVGSRLCLTCHEK